MTLLRLGGNVQAQSAFLTNERFAFARRDVPEGFMLDGKAFQIISGEMHPARISRPYWQHRIRMAKAMGLNTIAIYVMWNYHQKEPGIFDFASDTRNIAAFIRLCAVEGMLVYFALALMSELLLEKCGESISCPLGYCMKWELIRSRNVVMMSHPDVGEAKSHCGWLGAL